MNEASYQICYFELLERDGFAKVEAKLFLRRTKGEKGEQTK